MSGITFSTCFYLIKSNFDALKNFLSIVNEFNLVIYTDQKTEPLIHEALQKNEKNENKIKIVRKELEELYNYKYKGQWIKNHNLDWQINMLWSEKIQFVKETYTKKYFDTEYYGWCDIDYFRNRMNDMPTLFLQKWANPEKINQFFNENDNKEKIHYACISDLEYLEYLKSFVRNKNENGVPTVPIPTDQKLITDNFFMLRYHLVEGWASYYDAKLQLYFKNGFIKDDQIIIVDCVLSSSSLFHLSFERNPQFDPSFMFQRILI